MIESVKNKVFEKHQKFRAQKYDIERHKEQCRRVLWINVREKVCWTLSTATAESQFVVFLKLLEKSYGTVRVYLRTFKHENDQYKTGFSLINS